MFKIICELEKYEPPDQYGRKLQYIIYKNCIPCHFSDYQIVNNVHYDIRKIRQIINNALNTFTIGDNKFARLGMDINKEEYQELANKLYYVKDLTYYRYIGIFYENTLVENADHIFGAAWIYSAIVRHIEPTEPEQLANFWNKYFSIIYKFEEQYQDVPDRPYITYWQKFYFFHLDNVPNLNISKGTIVRANYKNEESSEYYAIDNLFLQYLFSKQQNNVQCLDWFEYSNQFTNDEQNQISVNKIYHDYTQALPILVMKQYLDSLTKNYICLNDITGNVMFTNQISKYILSSTYEDFVSIKAVIINGCNINLEVNIISTQNLLKSEADLCHTKLINEPNNKHLVLNTTGNELYQLDCKDFLQILAEVKDIIDEYY